MLTSPCAALCAALLALCLVSEVGEAGARAAASGRRTVAPGVVCAEYTLPGPFTLDVLEISLRDTLVRIESYRPSGLVRTSVQAAANDRTAQDRPRARELSNALKQGYPPNYVQLLSLRLARSCPREFRRNHRGQEPRILLHRMQNRLQDHLRCRSARLLPKNA